VLVYVVFSNVLCILFLHNQVAVCLQQLLLEMVYTSSRHSMSDDCGEIAHQFSCQYMVKDVHVICRH